MTIIIRLAFAAALSSAAAISFGVPESRALTYGDEPWCAVVDQGAGNGRPRRNITGARRRRPAPAAGAI